ncbi:MAG: hypothetical protein ABJB47_12545 [Actinomycetota bacterium]
MTQSFEEDVAEAGPGITPDTATETVPEAMVLEFSSLTTPYCWVITEDLFAGYDSTVPSTISSFGPPSAELSDVHEALCAGRWFRLASQDGQVLAVGRIYDPGGASEQAPLSEAGQESWKAEVIQYRQAGEWEAA